MALISEFIEQLYNYWRSHDRFLLCDSEGDILDQRPYRTFNFSIETLTTSDPERLPRHPGEYHAVSSAHLPPGHGGR